jgi:hypothetical protein
MADEHQNVVFTMPLELPKGARVQDCILFALPRWAQSTPTSKPTTIPLFLPYFTMIANNCDHEFKHPVLIAEFDIRPPEEGLGKKTDV